MLEKKTGSLYKKLFGGSSYFQIFRCLYKKFYGKSGPRKRQPVFFLGTPYCTSHLPFWLPLENCPALPIPTNTFAQNRKFYSTDIHTNPQTHLRQNRNGARQPQRISSAHSVFCYFCIARVSHLQRQHRMKLIAGCTVCSERCIPCIPRTAMVHVSRNVVHN